MPDGTAGLKRASSAVVIHFGELWLKGRNRSAFIGALRANVDSALAGERGIRLEHGGDRFMLYLGNGSDTASILGKLGRVFGISWFSPVTFADNDIDGIVEAAKGVVQPSATVRVVANRSFKGVGFTSSDIVGAFVKRAGELPFGFDKNAKSKLFVNVTRGRTLLYTDKIRGAGGLPVGVSGSGVVLFSGGIDSPVASYYAMKRGLRPVYVHVHALHSNAEAERSKIGRLLDILSGYCSSYVIYYVPAHVFQARAIGAPAKYELVLFKRFLMALAARIAGVEGAQTIVTGEALGQVASQTVRNMIASERRDRLLIMRPLIGFDKQEIIDRAVSIGTYAASTEPYRDVCSMRAHNPATGADPERIDALYGGLDLDRTVEETLAKATRIEPSGERVPVKQSLK